ncbi:MAG: response regulator [Planctomycetota bacterium]|nr:response regulator [Planctomycetota bacterium]
MSNKPFVALLVEDEEHDIVAVRRAWKQNNIANPLHVVRNGTECLDYLHRRGKYSAPATAPKPGMLLLDIKMPGMDGFAVIEEIRRDERLSSLPMVVLTGSDTRADRNKSYNLGVNAYIRKPLEFKDFSEEIRIIRVLDTG